MAMLNLKLVQRGRRIFPDEVLEMQDYPYIIGREEGDYLIKKDAQMSAVHFAAWFDKGSKSLIVRDLDSRTGIIIKGTIVKPHTNMLLSEGDIFQAGESLFMVVS